MHARSLLARALASAAVVGVAIVGPVTGAGAATNDTSTASAGITIDVGSSPVVTIGGAPTSGSGVNATVPVDGNAAATVGTPMTPASAAPVGGTAGPIAALGSTDRLVDADVAVHACIAAALLGGRAATGCGLPAGGSTPTLADALARVGVCARAAVLAGIPVTSCGGAPAGTGSDGPEAAPALVGLHNDAEVCLAATVLGVADPSGCSSTVDGGGLTVSGLTASGLTASGSGSADRSAASAMTEAPNARRRADVCLGLAVLTATDGTACGDVDASQIGNGARAGTVGAEPLSLAADAAGGPDTLAFTGGNSLLLTVAGLGSVVGGFLVRRAAHALLLT